MIEKLIFFKAFFLSGQALTNIRNAVFMQSIEKPTILFFRAHKVCQFKQIRHDGMQGRSPGRALRGGGQTNRLALNKLWEEVAISNS